MFPFNPEKVLSDIPKPSANAETDACTRDQAFQLPTTPVTPACASAVTALQDLINEDTWTLDEATKRRLQRHVQKLANATQLSFAERALLTEQVQFLAKMNNEAKVRRAAKAEVIGTARVMSYEDLEKARAERAEKTAAKVAKKAAKEAKDAAKEAKKAAKGKEKTTEETETAQDAVNMITPTVEVSSGSSAKRGRKRKHDVEETGVNSSPLEESGTLSESRAPVARMW